MKPYNFCDCSGPWHLQHPGFFTNHFKLISSIPVHYFPSNVMLKVHSKNDEQGILEVLESKIFFLAQPGWEDFCRIL